MGAVRAEDARHGGGRGVTNDPSQPPAAAAEILGKQHAPNVNQKGGQLGQLRFWQGQAAAAGSAAAAGTAGTATTAGLLCLGGEFLRRRRQVRRDGTKHERSV